MMGCLINCTGDSSPEYSHNPNENAHKQYTAKAMMASAKPGFPKANKLSDNPMFPTLGNMIGAKKPRTGNLATLRTMAPISPDITITVRAAAPIKPRSAGDMVSVLSVEKTRQGAPIFITKEEINEELYGRPNLAQVQPMETMIKTGATTLNSNCIKALHD